jgi:hypothetical protein
MLLTSIHHVYGAAVYHTPFRLHILFLSIPVLLFTMIVNKIHPGKFLIVYRIHAIVILVFSILLIGFYEGVYNHIIKNIAFWGGLSGQTLDVFFPPGIYEMPNDLFFELTGIAQGVLGILLAIRFIKLLKHGMWQRQRRACADCRPIKE